MFVAGGSEMVNGRVGNVKLKESGAGSMAVARAYNETVSGLEATPNVSSVTRSMMEGTDALGPGDGSPGNEGTAEIIRSEIR
jgi:hypothetical protein